MPNRLIKEGINESRGLASCSVFAQDLYKRLITYADDYGRFNADSQIMLARLYPLDLAVVTSDDLIEGLIELVGVKKISFYTGYDKEKIYGAFPNWGEHQRLRDSKKKNPDPDDETINDWYLQRYIPIDLKAQIIKRDGFKCQICGKHIAGVDDPKKLIKMGSGLYHIDHIIPVAQGGRATLENLQLTCPECNLSRKKRFTFDEIVAFSRNSRRVAASCGELPRDAENGGLKRREEKPTEEEEEERAHARDDHPAPFLSVEDAKATMDDHNDILNAADSVGMPKTDFNRARLIDLYAKYGKEAVLHGIMEAGRLNKVSVGYVEGVAKNYGEPRPEEGKVYMSDEEEQSILKSVFW